MAHAGIASRRKSEDIIKQGRVKVNGEIITEMGVKIDPESDCVEVDGNIISKENKIYLLLNKPIGYVTTVSDPRGRKTVMDLIAGIEQRIYPVGRLDYDSSGLLIMTNDGDLTNILTHPSYEIDKTYRVKIGGTASKKELKKLERGVKLEDGLTAPAVVKNISYKGDKSTVFDIVIHEGRNREVRRMCKKINYKVECLKRIEFANLKLAKLEEGNYRFLDEEEVHNLKKLKLEEGIN